MGRRTRRTVPGGKRRRSSAESRETERPAEVGAESAGGKIDDCAVLRDTFAFPVGRFGKFKGGGEQGSGADMVASLNTR